MHSNIMVMIYPAWMEQIISLAVAYNDGYLVCKWMQSAGGSRSFGSKALGASLTVEATYSGSFALENVETHKDSSTYTTKKTEMITSTQNVNIYCPSRVPANTLCTFKYSSSTVFTWAAQRVSTTATWVVLGVRVTSKLSMYMKHSVPIQLFTSCPIIFLHSQTWCLHCYMIPGCHLQWHFVHNR